MGRPRTGEQPAKVLLHLHYHGHHVLFAMLILTLLSPPCSYAVNAFVWKSWQRRACTARSTLCPGARAMERFLVLSPCGRDACLNRYPPIPTIQSELPHNMFHLATSSNRLDHSSKPPAHSSHAVGAIELEGVYIPPAALRFSASRSSGPGGQNVNKVNSRAELRVHVGRAEGSVAHPQPHTSPPTVIDRAVFEQLKVLAGSKISSRGDLIISSQEFRSLPLNRDACLSKLRSLLEEAVAATQRPQRIGAGSGSLPPVPPSEVASLIRMARRRDKESRGARKRDRQRVSLPCLFATAPVITGTIKEYVTCTNNFTL